MRLTTWATFLACLLCAACSSSPDRTAVTPEGDGDRGSKRVGPGTEILAGHLLVDLPEGAVLSQRRASIMAAPSATADETRVLLEPGGPEGTAKFVLLVTELYLLGTGDVGKDAEQLLAKGERSAPLEGARVPTAIIEPVEPPKLDRPVFVLGAIVAHPDGTLQQAEFFILPDMAEERAAYADRARAVVKTFQAGARRIEANGGKVDLGGRLSADVPPGFLLTTQQGPDFEVHRIRKLAKVGAPAGSLGVYLGGHPSLQHAQMERDAGQTPPVTKEEGALVGKKTTWITWSTPNGSRVREAIVEIGGHLAVHAFALASDDATLSELASIAATLKDAP